MKLNYLRVIAGMVVMLLGGSSLALADDAALLARINSLEKMMTQMSHVIEQQNTKIAALEGVRSTKYYGYIPDEGDKQSEFADLNGAHKWLKDLKMGGDLRLRYEAQSEHGASNAPDRNRFRYRLRYGAEKLFTGTPFHEEDKVEIGFRLASATNNDITSTNTTLDTQFTFKDISIDRAYAKYYPAWATLTTGNGIGLTGTEIGAGKFENPFSQGSTWMIWDADVTPEGIYEQFNFNLFKSDALDLESKFIAGQLVLEEGSGVDHDDAELYAYQVIFESKIKAFTEKPLKMKNAISYYNFNDFGLPGNFGAAGNNNVNGASLENNFDVINIYNEIGIPMEWMGAKEFKVYYDWFKNIGQNGRDSNGAAENVGWMLGAKVGKAKKQGTWELKYEFARIEANASPDVFNDGDFGGTDRRGSIVKGAYAVTDNLKLGVAAFFTDRLTGASSERDLWQVDLAWKF